jgi:hypothetical protein
MTSKVYSAPRVFDVATLFVVTFAYAILFAILSYSFNPKLTILLGSGFITIVGVCQAILFQGEKPRYSSVVAGVACAIGLYFFQSFSKESPIPVFAKVIAFPFYMLLGAGFGYLAGAVVGGVFLIADHLRQRWSRFSRQTMEELTSDASALSPLHCTENPVGMLDLGRVSSIDAERR